MKYGGHPVRLRWLVHVSERAHVLIFYYVIYVLITVVHAADYPRKDIRLNKPRFLTDGLLVSGEDDRCNQVSTWVVLITITVPTEIPRLQPKPE